MNDSPSESRIPYPVPLSQLGWTEACSEAFLHYSGPYLPGRVASRHRTAWEIFTEGGTILAGISGALKKLGRIPVVGDFVVLLHRPGTGVSMIADILPQRTRLTRGPVGREGADQVIAANIDTVFIVTAAGSDLNARRIERYLAIAHASGARPVIVINKCDLSGDPASLAGGIAAAAAGIPVIPVSAVTGEGLGRLAPYLASGDTVVLTGSSGVGKSTLINRLLDRPVQETSPIRDSDGKGRHTTTVRRLMILKGGALVIDTPGLREVGIGTAASGIAETFPDIAERAAGCRFSDCRHEQEPGCAVVQAVAAGTLPQSRLDSYHRLVRELAFAQEKAGIGLVRFERKRWKQYSSHGRLVKAMREAKEW